MHDFVDVWQLKAEVERAVCSEVSYGKSQRDETDESGWTLKFRNERRFELRQQ